MHGTFQQAIGLLQGLKADLESKFGAANQASDIFVIDKCIQVLQQAWIEEEQAFCEYIEEEEKKRIEKVIKGAFDPNEEYDPREICGHCGDRILFCTCQEAYKRAKMHWC